MHHAAPPGSLDRAHQGLRVERRDIGVRDNADGALRAGMGYQPAKLTQDAFTKVDGMVMGADPTTITWEFLIIFSLGAVSSVVFCLDTCGRSAIKAWSRLV